MSDVKLSFDGLQELREQLRNLPDDLTGEGKDIVLSHGDRAVAAIVAGYPEVSGNLKQGVSVRTLTGTGRFYAGVEVRSRSAHATLYEFGTAGERSFNGENRGQMPPAPPDRAAGPKIGHERRDMQGDLRDLLTRAGLDVSGSDE
jgi:hypothetical protein